MSFWKALKQRQTRATRVHVVGDLGTQPWITHLWLNRCQKGSQYVLVEAHESADLLLHLEPLHHGLPDRKLQELRRYPCVLDPIAEQAECLAGHGIRAHWLDPAGSCNGWLERHFNAEQACKKLGLPNPATLRQYGEILCLGPGADAAAQSLEAPIWQLPAFESCHLDEADNARLLAAWLHHCAQLGLQLVRLQPSPLERHSKVWLTLAAQSLQPVILQGADPAELCRQLRANGICPTPKPTWDVLVNEETNAEPARAAVCVSVYNYRDRILHALTSAAAQQETSLELVLVDDHSSDDSVEIMLSWLQQHAKRFRRAILVRHHHNAGLAAARNTAFGLAKAEWCFVLDADNVLKPQAVGLCLAVAETSPESNAVVHPIVELRTESMLPGQPDQTLLSHIPWQRDAFRHGNQIDAMAMVRRRHWQHVGGFSHIPGGWEDYDFWCKLIDAGFSGVICPQKLAIYNRHNQSMQATSTLASQNCLQEILQKRHPWLELTEGSKAER
jgi:GT2 family glycosyltransferase